MLNRPTLTRIAGRPVLDYRPAKVRPGDAFVDLFAPAVEIVDEDPSGLRLQGKCKWVTQTPGPDGSIGKRFSVKTAKNLISHGGGLPPAPKIRHAA